MDAQKPTLSFRLLTFLLLLLTHTFSCADTLKVPENFTTIQSAVDAAKSGDTVLVAPGAYTERLTIDKEIVLLSESGAGSTEINSSGLQILTSS